MNESIITPDFFIKSKNKIIEFDGTYYHRENPENKKREEYRDKQIIFNNYQILHIKENEYNKDKENTIEKCINFLK